jgi:hypothetical protein
VRVTDYAEYVVMMPGCMMVIMLGMHGGHALCVHDGYHAMCGSMVVCRVCVTVITLGVA